MAKSATSNCAQYMPVHQAFSRSEAILRGVIKLANGLNRQLGKGAKEGRWHWTTFR